MSFKSLTFSSEEPKYFRYLSSSEEIIAPSLKLMLTLIFSDADNNEDRQPDIR